MAAFATFNQFDARFKGVKNFGNARSACPIFSLLTAYNFLKDGNVSKERHEKNLEVAVANYEQGSLPKYMDFDTVCSFLTDASLLKNINGTTPALVKEFGYNAFFKEDENKKNYCTIILKNSNFIAILVRMTTVGAVYHLRDCHEKEQYNFGDVAALKDHLKKKYQFEEMTVVDGVLIEEFGNIECIILDQEFKIHTIRPALELSSSSNSTTTSVKSAKSDVKVFTTCVQPPTAPAVIPTSTAQTPTTSTSATSTSTTTSTSTATKGCSYDEMMAAQMMMDEGEFDEGAWMD